MTDLIRIDNTKYVTEPTKLDKIIHLFDINRYNSAKEVIKLEAPEIMELLEIYEDIQNMKLTVLLNTTGNDGKDIIVFNPNLPALYLTNNYGIVEFELVNLPSKKKHALLVTYSPSKTTNYARREAGYLLEEFSKLFPGFRDRFYRELDTALIPV